MLFDRKSWPQHRGWFFLTVAAVVAATVWYFTTAARADHWPGGGSLPGFTFGIVGGAIILFEMLLWFRKKVPAWRVGRAQTWLRAHIWLGLLCFPLLIYHSGLRLGGTLSTALMVLLTIVITSGIWGLVLQNILPARLVDDVPAETSYSQIAALSDELIAEGDDLMRATAKVPNSEPLPEFYEKLVVPFLRGGAGTRSPFYNPRRAAALFQTVKTRVPSAAHEAVDALEGFCDQRRQWDEQLRIHRWLHGWLWVHLPLSAALVVLMFAHIWFAIMYW